VWGGDSGFKDSNDYARVCINRCKNIGHFDAAELDSDNPAIPAAIKTQEERELLLADNDRLHYIARLIDAFTERRDTLTMVLETVSDHYQIQKLFML
jgi:hypothetical protein